MSDKGIKLTPRVFNKILGTPKMLIECKQSSTPLPGKSRKSLRFSQNFSLDMSGISQSSFVEQPTFGNYLFSSRDKRMQKKIYCYKVFCMFFLFRSTGERGSLR